MGAYETAINEINDIAFLKEEIFRQKKRADEFLATEQALSRAYLRLRNLIPGAFDTPHAPTSEEIWTHTEACLKNLKASSITNMVHEFHTTYRQAAPTTPQLLNNETQILRLCLINEELQEYVEAVIKDDIVGIADALVDIVYVVAGTAVAHGLTRFDEMIMEVHRSNMSKLDADGKPIIREDGKVLKGPNYTPPDIERFL